MNEHITGSKQKAGPSYKICKIGKIKVKHAHTMKVHEWAPHKMFTQIMKDTLLESTYDQLGNLVYCGLNERPLCNGPASTVSVLFPVQLLKMIILCGLLEFWCAGV